MSDTDSLTVAKVFEECIYRRFGAPSLIRHGREPRFMSEMFQAFAELIQAQSRSTLSYRPQGDGQQEWSVKTVMQSVKFYVEDPLQQDWDEIAERLVFAINNSHDMTRKETPFYLSVAYMERVKSGLVDKLVHRWHGPFRVKQGCPQQTETMAHILNHCDANNASIRALHDRVLDGIAEQLRVVKRTGRVELRINQTVVQAPTSTLRPDIQLVDHDHKRVVLADLVVAFDADTAGHRATGLDAAHADKLVKYAPLCASSNTVVGARR
ncbi:reverse transcriptase [Phytophthora megakarya]|uniref:Reverse transcriptase n=1 Tax=Phytophthora megakarya TaxID=4795 RepID=A0A225WQX3_9STRA|nr:reverse transcriptase [Phytophthora megakarya]